MEESLPRFLEKFNYVSIPSGGGFSDFGWSAMCVTAQIEKFYRVRSLYITGARDTRVVVSIVLLEKLLGYEM